MKKISILFLVLLSYLVGFGQAEQTRSSPTITVVDANAFEARSFRVPVYYDTIAANVVPQLDSAGKIIYTFSTNSLWFRANDPKKWVPISSTKGNNGGDTLFAQLPAFFDSTSRPGSTILKILRGNGVVTGGTVTVDSCRSLDIIPTTIILNYTEYTSIATRLTVPVGDGSFPRTDEVVDSLGTIVLKVGIPASTPLGKPINAATEWILASYTMQAGATCLSVTQIIVWDENLGTTSEFNLTTSGTISANGNSLTNPFHLTKAIFINTYDDGGSLIFTYSSPLTAQASEIFKFWVYLNGAFGSNQFQVQFFNGSTPVGIPIAFNTGYGFNPNDSNQYQQVVIPFSAFNLTNQTFTKVVITFRGSDLSGAKGLYIDYVQLQTGNNIPNSQLVLTTTGSSGASTYDPFTNILNIPVYSGGGGSETMQNTFDNSVGASDNPIINVGANNFNVTDGGANSFEFNPSNYFFDLSLTDGTAISQINAQSDLIGGNVKFSLYSTDGSNEVGIEGKPIDNNIDYLSGTHTFDGQVLLNSTTSGATTDSVLTRDAATGQINMRDASSFGRTLQQVFDIQNGNALLNKNDTITLNRHVLLAGDTYQGQVNGIQILDSAETLIGAAYPNSGNGNDAVMQVNANTDGASFHLAAINQVSVFSTADIFGNTNPTDPPSITYSASNHNFSGTVAIGGSSATDKLEVTGNVALMSAGNKLKITEGSNGSVGQTALISGTKAITISGITTSSRAFITLVTPSGTSLTVTYQAVCTSNTLTIQANIAAGTINTADGSTLNYFIIN